MRCNMRLCSSVQLYRHFLISNNIVMGSFLKTGRSSPQTLRIKNMFPITFRRAFMDRSLYNRLLRYFYNRLKLAKKIVICTEPEIPIKKWDRS